MVTNDFGYMEKQDLFLNKLYDKHFNANPKGIFHFATMEFKGFHYYDDIGKELGFDQRLSRDIAYTLMTKSMIISSTINEPKLVAIRDKGIEYIEKKNRESKRPAIPPIQINAAERANVQVNQNSNGNIQYSYSGDVNYNDIDNVLTLVQMSYDMLKLSAEQKNTMDHEIHTIRKEFEADHPNKSAIEKSKNIMLDLLTQTSANLLAAGLIFLISNIPNIH